MPTMLAVCDTATGGSPVYWEWLNHTIARVTALRGEAWRDQATPRTKRSEVRPSTAELPLARLGT